MQSLFCTSYSCSQSPQDPKLKIVLAIILSMALLATGCNAQWISTALADLPVLTQMALNIATLAATLESGQQANPADLAAIQNISSQASRDLTVLQSLYNQYKASPDATTLQKIQSTISTINASLPALLKSAHISDATLSAKVTAGVNLILTTVSSFAALMPQATAATSQRAGRATFSIPTASQLKKQWNQQVCSPAASSASVVAACVVR